MTPRARREAAAGRRLLGPRESPPRRPALGGRRAAAAPAADRTLKSWTRSQRGGNWRWTQPAARSAPRANACPPPSSCAGATSSRVSADRLRSCSRALPASARVRPEPWLSPVPLSATMLGLPAHRQSLSLRPRGSPHRQRRLSRAGVGGGLRRLSPAAGRQDRLAVHPLRPRRRLPRLPRWAAEARRHPRLSRQPRDPPARGKTRRPGAMPTPPRPRQAEGRGARPLPPSARRDRPRRSAPLPRGRRSSRAGPRRRVGEREHAADARARRAGDAGRGARRRRRHSRRRATRPSRPGSPARRLPPPRRPSRGGGHLHAQRGRASPRGTRLGSWSSASARAPKKSCCAASARNESSRL